MGSGPADHDAIKGSAALVTNTVEGPVTAVRSSAVAAFTGLTLRTSLLYGVGTFVNVR